MENNEPRTMILKGFTFQNAYSGLMTAPNNGSSFANIQNCRFTKCGVANNSNYKVIATHYGGLRFDNCIFDENPGFLLYFDYKDTNQNLGNFFVNCTFVNNDYFAVSNVNGKGQIYFTNCILYDTRYDTVQYLYRWNTFIFQNSSIKDNYFSKTTSNFNSNPNFSNASKNDYSLLNYLKNFENFY